MCCVASFPAAIAAIVAGVSIVHAAPPPTTAATVSAAATTASSAPSVPPSKDAPAEEAAPVEIDLKSHDGHDFKALYFTTPAAASNAVLIVPDLGHRRDHFLRLARSLRERGYRVLSMDNTGQLRQVGPGVNKVPTFTTMTTKILDILVQDVASALASLRTQRGVGKVAILGFGIGANAGLIAGGADSAVGAVGVTVPSYGCEGFDPYAAFGDMNSRPVLLAESRKRYQSDMSSAFEHIMAKRKDLPFEHVMLARDREALTQADLEDDYEASVLAWIVKAFPSVAP